MIWALRQVGEEDEFAAWAQASHRAAPIMGIGIDRPQAAHLRLGIHVNDRTQKRYARVAKRNKPQFFKFGLRT